MKFGIIKEHGNKLKTVIYSEIEDDGFELTTNSNLNVVRKITINDETKIVVLKDIELGLSEKMYVMWKCACYLLDKELPFMQINLDNLGPRYNIKLRYPDGNELEITTTSEIFVYFDISKILDEFLDELEVYIWKLLRW